MSKSEGSQRLAHSGQLKKDINQAVYVLQSLTNGLAKIESSLVEADGIRATERHHRENISKLQQEISDLQDKCLSIEAKSQEEIVSFATANMHLNQQFEIRLKKKDQERQSALEDIQKREASQEHSLKHALDLQKSEVSRLKEVENASRNQLEVKLKEQTKGWKIKEDSLRSKLKEVEEQVTELSAKNKDLAQEVQEHQIMLKGRDTEIARLTSRLGGLEAFSLDSPDRARSVINGLQSRLHDFCVLCVESAGNFPGWNQIPRDLQHPGLPRYYSTDSAAGRYVLSTAIQHSIWTALVDEVFASYGLQDCRGIFRVANALARKNRSREAVWRVLTTNTILEDRELLQALRHQLEAVALRLTRSWDLFQDEQQQDGFRAKLSELLYDQAKAWLSLLKLRNRICVSLKWDPGLFETDSGDDSVQLPGNFVHDAVTPVLFLSPAFLEETTDGRTMRPTLIQKGKALMKDSPLLLAALKEEQEVSSPRQASKNAFPRFAKEPGS